MAVEQHYSSELDMSLISLRNLTAPLRSKAQIVAIVIAGLLVAAVRLMGNGASGDADARRDRSDRTVDVEAQDRNFRELLNNQPKRRRVEPQDDMLNGLVDGSFERERQKQREAEHKSSEFDDIRRSLGLE